MRTEEVLDSIDHALEDWTVSVDAMRWAPEKRAMPEPVRAFLPPIAFHVQVDARPLVQAVEQMARSLSEWAATANSAAIGIEGLAVSLNREESRPPIDDVESLRAYALTLRRTRNTGPSTDVVHKRRPRKHQI